jgi:superfamily II DNA or RNA helicase
MSSFAVEGYKYAAEFALAPFRLGLSATPERGDEGDALLQEIVGEFVYRLEAQELAGEYLADYIVERIEVELSDEERREYERERLIYTDFKRRKNLPYGHEGWRMFLIHSAKVEEGRRAMKAYRNQKKIALGTDSKLRVLHDLLVRHKHDRTLIFTAENADGLPDFAGLSHSRHHARNESQGAENSGSTHSTKATFSPSATSKVLNEGVKCSRRERGDYSFRVPVRAANISAFGQNFAQESGQTGYSLRSRDAQHERRVHLREKRSDARQFQDVKQRFKRGLFE